MSLRILIVEDDADLRMLYKLLLEHLGEVKLCPDAYQAIAALQDATFDVVLLDLMLPGASGLELLRRLGDMGCTVPIVVMSGLVDGPLRRQALGLGAREVLRKDADLDLLVTAVVDAAKVSSPI